MSGFANLTSSCCNNAILKCFESLRWQASFISFMVLENIKKMPGNILNFCTSKIEKNKSHEKNETISTGH